MAGAAQSEVTALLLRWRQGDEDAFNQLFSVVYSELRRLAGHYMRGEAPSPTLQCTALVHEVYLRLVKEVDREWSGRAHFFAVASRVIRHLLVDHARQVGAQKRGGGAERVRLDEALTVPAPDDVDLLDLDEALHALAVIDPVKARIVELRFFGGLSVPETADVLQLAPSAVKRHFGVARVWLHRRLRNGPVASV